MSEKQSKFDIWWTSPGVKRKVAAFYSIGATVVIVGAMFKILHLPGAAVMLGAGMTIEAMLFMLGVLDKPHKEYHWENVFDFDGKGAHNVPSDHPAAGAIAGGHAHKASTHEHATEHAPVKQSEVVAAPASAPVVAPQVIVQPTVISAPTSNLASLPSLSDEDAAKITEGIKKLADTTKNLADITNVAAASQKLAKDMESASTASQGFATSQEALKQSSEALVASYKGISEGLGAFDTKGVAEGMIAVEKGTKQYAASIETINKELAASNIMGLSTDLQEVQKGTKEYALKVGEVNKSLTSINSIYEIQLKSVQSQSEVLIQQNEKLQLVNNEYTSVITTVQKMMTATQSAADEAEKLRANSSQLSKSISDLNQVYGNMLNALS